MTDNLISLREAMRRVNEAKGLHLSDNLLHHYIDELPVVTEMVESVRYFIRESDMPRVFALIDGE